MYTIFFNKLQLGLFASLPGCPRYFHNIRLDYELISGLEFNHTQTSYFPQRCILWYSILSIHYSMWVFTILWIQGVFPAQLDFEQWILYGWFFLEEHKFKNKNSDWLQSYTLQTCVLFLWMNSTTRVCNSVYCNTLRVHSLFLIVIWSTWVSYLWRISDSWGPLYLHWIKVVTRLWIFSYSLSWTWLIELTMNHN